MIFNIKINDNFTFKAILIAGGHYMAPTLSITYYSAVTRESVRLEFIISSMNDLDIFACNIGNAYLNSPYWGKIWTEAGSEIGSQEEYVFQIVRALYGLKSSEASWRDKLVDKLN